MPERTITGLLREVEQAALRHINTELGAWQVALGTGDTEASARACSGVLDALDVYSKAHLERSVALEEEEEDGGG